MDVGGGTEMAQRRYGDKGRKKKAKNYRHYAQQRQNIVNNKPTKERRPSSYPESAVSLRMEARANTNNITPENNACSNTFVPQPITSWFQQEPEHFGFKLLRPGLKSVRKQKIGKFALRDHTKKHNPGVLLYLFF